LPSTWSEEILHLGIMMVVCVSISVFISVCSLQLNSDVLDVWSCSWTLLF
jgi:hypothetical protein